MFKRPAGWGDPQWAAVPGARIAYRTFGSGPTILFLHGWPVWSATYRHLVPRLADRFACILPDSAGLGETEWDDGADLGFPAQAERMERLADSLGLARYAVVAHDTGATIARLLAARDERVRGLVLINTELPGHRPPFIPLYQRLMGLPGGALSFQLLLRSRLYLRSAMGFGGCYYDRSLIDGEPRELYAIPLMHGGRPLEGVIRYLRAIDWRVVDGLSDTHARIAAPVKLVWGADDPTFPVQRARAIVHEFQHSAGIAEIPRARLLVHEERPELVAEEIVRFLDTASVRDARLRA